MAWHLINRDMKKLLQTIRNPHNLTHDCLVKAAFCISTITGRFSKQNKADQNMSNFLNIGRRNRRWARMTAVFLFCLAEIEFLIEMRKWCLSLLIRGYHPMYDEMSQRKAQTPYQSPMNSNSISQLSLHHFSKNKNTL